MNLTMKRGDTPAWRIAVTDSNGPVDLSDATLTFIVAKSYESEPWITKTLGNGITIEDEDGGIAKLVLGVVDTVSFPDYTTRLKYDLRMTRGAEAFTLVSGILTIEPDVRHE